MVLARDVNILKNIQKVDLLQVFQIQEHLKHFGKFVARDHRMTLWLMVGQQHM